MQEAEWAFGISPEDALKSPDLLEPMLRPRVGILLTAGAKGASYYLRGVGQGFCEAYPVEAKEFVNHSLNRDLSNLN